MHNVLMAGGAIMLTLHAYHNPSYSTFVFVFVAAICVGIVAGIMEAD